MLPKRLLKPIFEDDSITRGLGDPEARILIEWLVTRSDQLSKQTDSAAKIESTVRRLCLHARAISRFVALWGNPQSRGAACQLAATQRFCWPLPTTDVDPCELMLDILWYEEQTSEA